MRHHGEYMSSQSPSTELRPRLSLHRCLFRIEPVYDANVLDDVCDEEEEYGYDRSGRFGYFEWAFGEYLAFGEYE